MAMIPADHLEKLKKLFAGDGITLTEQEALEAGLWLMARVKPVLKSIPPSEMPLFGQLRGEMKALRERASFVNLHEWRRR